MEDFTPYFLLYNDIINRLKEIERTGWKISGIEDAETVAEHTFHVCSVALLISRLISKKVDYEKLFVMSVLHDMPESIYGDIPTPNKTKADRDREKKWVADTLRKLGYPPEWGDELENLSSLEAMIIKISDCISTIFQGLSYMEEHKHIHLNEIIENNLERLSEIKDVVDEHSIKTLIEFIENLVFDRLDKRR